MRILNLIATAGLLASAAHASGQCTSLIRSQVPDFDQRRSTDFFANPPVVGLDNSGSMYCVPTSWTNFMAWLANRGYTNAMGDSGNWAAASRYQLVTNRISQMGGLMSTDGEGGTDSSDAIEGLVDYLDERNVGLPAIAFSYVAEGDWAPKPQDLRSWMNMGALVCVCFGRYQQNGSEWERIGGHCMTLVSVKAPCNGQGWVIGLRDPWTGSGDSRFTQSNFATRTIELFGNTFNFDGDVRKQYRDINDTDGDRWYLDKIQVLLPMVAISGSAGGTTVNVSHLTGLWPDQPQQQQIAAPGSLLIHSALPMPSFQSIAVITRPVVGATNVPAKAWSLDPATGEYLPMGDLPSLPTDATFDRRGNLLLTTGTQLRVYDMSAETPSLERTVTTGLALDAICTNPATDTIYGLDTGRRAIQVFTGGDLDNPPTERNIGGTFSLGGMASIAIRPNDNSVWITTDTSTVVRRLGISIVTGDYVSVETVPVPAGMSPKSLGFTDQGDMVLGDGSVRVLREGRASWFEVADHALAGAPVAGRFMVPRSGHNHGAAQLLPAWSDLLDPSGAPGTVVLDCPGDFDANGILEVPDIFAFLSAWFAADVRADLNGSGANDVPDIFEFLSRWFAGCTA